jgi:hypothetical protein
MMEVIGSILNLVGAVVVISVTVREYRKKNSIFSIPPGKKKNLNPKVEKLLFFAIGSVCLLLILLGAALFLTTRVDSYFLWWSKYQFTLGPWIYAIFFGGLLVVFGVVTVAMKLVFPDRYKRWQARNGRLSRGSRRSFLLFSLGLAIMSAGFFLNDRLGPAVVLTFLALVNLYSGLAGSKSGSPAEDTPG